MTTPAPFEATVVHGAAMSTNLALAAARAELHQAAAAQDEHRRQQYARSARDNACNVLTSPGCSPREREYAGLYFAQAHAIAEGDESVRRP
jgi:hypothetical protein